MNNTPTPMTDEWGTISEEDGHWSSHKRRERWIKTFLLKTSEELQTELTAITEQRDKLAELSGFGEFDKQTELTER
jgi:predicted mannosyl-3-phosphoglycerate phosphatase (HAD superfamily)